MSTNIARQPCIFRHSSCHLERMIRGTKREGKSIQLTFGSHLKKVLAHFSSHYMANHSIFANQTFPNALEPPFSNLYRITIIITKQKRELRLVSSMRFKISKMHPVSTPRTIFWFQITTIIRYMFLSMLHIEAQSKHSS